MFASRSALANTFEVDFQGVERFRLIVFTNRDKEWWYETKPQSQTASTVRVIRENLFTFKNARLRFSSRRGKCVKHFNFIFSRVSSCPRASCVMIFMLERWSFKFTVEFWSPRSRSLPYRRQLRSNCAIEFQCIWLLSLAPWLCTCDDCLYITARLKHVIFHRAKLSPWRIVKTECALLVEFFQSKAATTFHSKFSVASVLSVKFPTQTFQNTLSRSKLLTSAISHQSIISRGSCVEISN